MSMAVAYTAWASRYLYEYGGTREDFGLVTVNARSNGTRNPLATLREPITMEEYLAARMIREPFGMLDMDIPTDGADAFVVTTAERAADLARPPVLIHAATTGTAACAAEDQLADLAHHGQHVVAESLRAKSDLWLSDVDVFLPYDGFTIITLGWIENLGWCGPGEAGAFLRQHWDSATNRVLINGRIPLNPHGGALAEGATRGSGYVREAVQQLRGEAGDAAGQRGDNRPGDLRRLLLQLPGIGAAYGVRARAGVGVGVGVGVATARGWRPDTAAPPSCDRSSVVRASATTTHPVATKNPRR